MRITSEYMSNNLMKNLNNNMERLDKFNQQLSTGKKFQLPSDDPTGVATSMDLNSTIEENDQNIRNLDEGIGWSESTDSALGQMSEVLQRTRELASRGANGSLSNSDREAVADEVHQLRENVVEIANTTYNDRYIFSGQKTQIKPYQGINDFTSLRSDSVSDPEASLGYNGSFDIKVDGALKGGPSPSVSVTASDSLKDIKTKLDSLNDVSASITSNQELKVTTSGDELTIDNPSGDNIINNLNIKTYDGYRGDNSKISRKISSSSKIQINQSGKEFENILNSLENLEENLRNDETSDISNHNIEELDKNIDTILQMRSENGARQKRMEMTKNRLEEDKIKFEKLLSKNEDVDIAKTIMDLKMSENVYRAALSSGSRIIQPSLVDFIK